MSEPFLERLSRFTPDAGGLNRDALLFAAGQSSARANRGWMSLTALLACTQLLSLILLWPNPSRPGGGTTANLASVPEWRATVEPAARDALANPGVWSARHSVLESELVDRPIDNLTLIDSEPPLRAFTPALSN